MAIPLSLPYPYLCKVEINNESLKTGNMKIIDLTNQKFGKLTVIKKKQKILIQRKNVHIGCVYVIAEKVLSWILLL